MTWTITDWTVPQKWATAAILNEFVAAINERLAVVGVSPVPAVTAGDSVQVHALIESWQAAIEPVVGLFVVSHVAGAYRGDGHSFAGESAIPYYADLPAVLAAAGFGARTTWRAYPIRPSKGGADQARQIAAGDVLLGPLFDDLYKVLNVLRWTWLNELGGTSWSVEDGASGNNGYGLGLFGSLPTPEAHAKTDAIADYDAEPYHDDTTPFAYSWFYDDGPGGNFSAVLERHALYGKWTFAEAVAVERDVDFYNIGYEEGFVNTFAANGDWPAGYVPEELCRYDTVLAATGGSGLSALFGTRPPGNAPAWGAEDEETGYMGRPGGPLAVFKWAFSYK
jgi:hypothetical protein